MTILLGNGDGTFAAAAAGLAVGVYPTTIAVGDFKGNGILDLAVANMDSDNVTILLGNGDGTFNVSPVSPAAGNSPAGVVVWDFNGDGIPDLAVAGHGGVTVLLGNGDGTFTAVAGPGVEGSYFIAAGDFNGDGKADLAVQANYSTYCYDCDPVMGIVDMVTVLLSQPAVTTTVTATGISFPVNTGTHLVEASYSGDINFQASISAQVGLAAYRTQTITFPNPGTQNYGTPLTLTATASSGLPVSFASTDTSVCTISGNTATFFIAGTCGIWATQAGNADFSAAPEVGHAFTVNHEAQIITFPAIPTTTLATGSVILNATATSHLPISYSSTNTSVCTVSGSTVTLLNFGTCGIWAAQAGNGIVPPAPQVGHAFEVTLATQTIPFARPATQWLGEMTFNLNATASSGLPVSYASTTPSICTVAGSTVTLLALGECGIWATQPGNTSYAAAPQFGHMFLVAREAQTINFTYPGEHPFGTSFTLNATASSGLPVTFTSMDPSVCTVSGSTVSLSPFHGYCGILADQAGNAYYGPAPEVGHIFLVYAQY